MISVNVGAWHVPFRITGRALKLGLLGALDKVKHVKPVIISWQAHFSVTDTAPSPKQHHHHLPFSMHIHLPLPYPRRPSYWWFLERSSLKTL